MASTVFVLLSATPILHAETPGTLKISSDTMRADNFSMLVTFFGNVKAEYGLMKIQAEKLEAFFDKQMKRLSRLEATGKVIIFQGEKSISGEKAVFDQEKGTITVTGKPRMTDGKSVVEGEKLMVDIFARQGEITGGVKATFTPSDLEEIETRFKKELSDNPGE